MIHLMHKTLRNSAKFLAVLSAVVSIGLVSSSCADKSKDAGGFGEAKPTKSDGTLHKPLEEKAPPDFEHAVTVEALYDVASGKLTATLRLKPGYHAYAPGEEVGKPVTLLVDPKTGWSVQGDVTIPAGTKKDLGALGTSMILEGDVPLTAIVKGGAGEIRGTVMAQVCTDSACDRPKPHPFMVPST